MDNRSDIKFFISWMSNDLSAIKRFYNPSSFKKKMDGSVEYYRLDEKDISFDTDKIIDYIAKKSNTPQPEGKTVKEMREFMEKLLGKIDDVEERFNETYPNIPFIFKVRVKYIPSFIMNFIVENAISNEKTNDKNAIRFCDHRTGIGMADNIKDFMNYISVVEYYQNIYTSDIKEIFNFIITKLKAKNDDDELDFKSLKRGTKYVLERALQQKEKFYSISRIMYDQDYETKMTEMINKLADTRYGRDLYNVIREKKDYINSIRGVMRCILGRDLESLTVCYGEESCNWATRIYNPMSSKTTSIKNKTVHGQNRPSVDDEWYI